MVRGVASGRLAQIEKETYGQRVVDYFSSRPHNPYEQAETLEDLRDGLHVVRTLVQMGRFQDACYALTGDLTVALLANLEANAEVVALLRPFFPFSWGSLPQQVKKEDAAYLANYAAVALGALGQMSEELAASETFLAAGLELKDWSLIRTGLMICSDRFVTEGRLAKSEFCLRSTQEAARLTDDQEDLFVAGLALLTSLVRCGRWAEAEAMWNHLDPMGRNWRRGSYRPGYAELTYAFFRFYKGDLLEEHLARAEQLAHEGHSRQVIRFLHELRGEWRIEQGQWELAVESLHEAVRMARAVGQSSPTAEVQLLLAKFRLGELSDPLHEAEQLAHIKENAHRALAELWLAIGNMPQAKKHALTAYKRAWADGEPFVFRYELDRSRAVLQQLGAEIPELPAYDPVKDEKLPWEDAVVAGIEQLRAEKVITQEPTTRQATTKKAKGRQ